MDLTTPAQDIIKFLDLAPHPEGGYYRRTFCDSQERDGRPVGTAIYYLLTVGDCSAWHRIDAAEIWHYYAGAPLSLTVSENGHDAHSIRLGARLFSGEHPQWVVPPMAWQTAESLGSWTLVGCTVAPGFTFDTFELAPADWRPTPRSS